MKKTITGLAMLVVLILASNALATETTVKGRLFTHWMIDQTDGADNANEFVLGRAYITVQSKLSDFSSLRITSDLRETDVGGRTRYDVIIKYGYIDWKPAFARNALKLRFGLQPTPFFDTQNKFWGRRYISKTVGDRNKYLTTSDLGASVHLGLGAKGKLGSLVAAVFNGTAYSSLGEENKQKDFNVFADIHPISGNEDFKNTRLVAQLYSGVQNVVIPDSVSGSDYKRRLISAGGVLVYRHLFDLGADLHWFTMGNGPQAADSKKSGFSIFGTLYFEDLVADASVLHALNIFGRVDLNDPDTDTNNDGDQHIIAGIECVPVKGFKASVNYRTTQYDSDAEVTEKALFVNAMFRF